MRRLITGSQRIIIYFDQGSRGDAILPNQTKYSNAITQFASLLPRCDGTGRLRLWLLPGRPPTYHLLAERFEPIGNVLAPLS